mgnify:CR=1 FL=1
MIIFWYIYCSLRSKQQMGSLSLTLTPFQAHKQTRPMKAIWCSSLISQTLLEILAISMKSRRNQQCPVSNAQCSDEFNLMIVPFAKQRSIEVT